MQIDINKITHRSAPRGRTSDVSFHTVTWLSGEPRDQRKDHVTTGDLLFYVSQRLELNNQESFPGGVSISVSVLFVFSVSPSLFPLSLSLSFSNFLPLFLSIFLSLSFSLSICFFQSFVSFYSFCLFFLLVLQGRSGHIYWWSHIVTATQETRI